MGSVPSYAERVDTAPDDALRPAAPLLAPDDAQLGLHAELQVVGARADQGVRPRLAELRRPRGVLAGVDVRAGGCEPLRPDDDEVVRVLAVVVDVELDRAGGHRLAVRGQVELA